MMILFLFALGYIPVQRIIATPLRFALALPVGVLINAISLLILTWIAIPFSVLSILIADFLIMDIVLISLQPLFKLKSSYLINASEIRINKAFQILSSIILLCTLLYSIGHALLPTSQYDSLAHWNIRSKISYSRAELEFTRAEDLIEKPYYPVLYHATQITAMQLQPEWNEMVANGVHTLLTLSLIASVYLLLRERGGAYARLMLALLLSLPLLAMHTGAQYADLPLILYASLSLLFFERYVRLKHVTDLLLSAVMVTACVWTKSEGLIFCLAPWLAMVLLHMKKISYPMLWALTTSLLWPVFLLVHGYNLTPHGGEDAALGISTDALHAYFSALFVTGSFGLFWYALIPLLIIVANKKLYSPTLVWGGLSFLGYSAVYLLTSNAQYLILGQSFDRQMLLPAALLMLSISSLFSENNSVVLR